MISDVEPLPLLVYGMLHPDPADPRQGLLLPFSTCFFALLLLLAHALSPRYFIFFSCNEIHSFALLLLLFPGLLSEPQVLLLLPPPRASVTVFMSEWVFFVRSRSPCSCHGRQLTSAPRIDWPCRRARGRGSCSWARASPMPGRVD